MARSALRFFACAGVLAASLLMSGASAGIVSADTGDAAGAGTEAPAVTSKPDENNSDSDATGASNPDPPTSTFGNGREDVGVQTNEQDKKNNDATATTKKFKASLTIPIFRIPRQSELPASGLPNPSLFYTTIVIPVPTLGDLFAAMQPPQPTPAPGPAFRTQEQAPPVVDSAGGATGGGGGGIDPLALGVAAEPPVLQTPLVIAPLPIPVSAPPPVVPLGAAAGTAPGVTAEVAVAGARVPLIRGSLQPTPPQPASGEPATNAAAPMSGQPTRLGYPRELRTPTATEVTMLALPGAAGLLLLTMSGGVIGYRQANSARQLRSQAAARFLR
ncbi:MAG TPA: hypothetical protein VL634_04195 [Mycobacterium sp.]|nr:hypothetical protein [Mycobacterium sp.]